MSGKGIPYGKRVGIEADGGNMMFHEICIYEAMVNKQNACDLLLTHGNPCAGRCIDMKKNPKRMK